jgi:UDP-N-acetylglucosamine--N-acetylmuramyl-(pentapeptide) pyrophosphoryl-undecaprenol N-acetylglucosamine transferase
MELSYTCKPAILIPYPFAAENHQEKNAIALVERNSAIMIKEDEISKLLIQEINRVINDDILLESLRTNISKIYDKDAPQKIYKEIKNIVK